MSKRFLLLTSFLLLSTSCSKDVKTSVESPKEAETTSNKLDKAVGTFKYSPDFSIYCPDIKAMGDCTLIQYGKTDILIDAGGSEENSAPIIYDMLNTRVTDGNLEMVIITHGDGDHIESLYSEQGVSKWLKMSGHSIGTIVDFDSSGHEDSVFTKTSRMWKDEYLKFSSLAKEYNSYEKYQSFLDEFDDRIGNTYSALQCWNNRDGASREYSLSVDGTLGTSGGDCSIEFLYNNFYDHTEFVDSNGETVDLYNADNSAKNSAIKNSQSVCTLLTYGDKEFLFTGDLEEFNSSNTQYPRIYGESLLVDNNPSLQDGVFFYKAGHHGSKTSSSTRFLNTLRPNHVLIEAVANNIKGSGYYGFPHEKPIRNITKWTDKVYINGKYDDETGNNVPYFGNIEFSFDSNGRLVAMSDGNDSGSSIYETDWFKSNRSGISTATFLTTGKEYGGHCTYIKSGLTDILIDCGFDSTRSKSIYIDRIKNLCNDGVIEYVIVTSPLSDYSNDLLTNNGLFSELETGDIIESIGVMITPPHNPFESFQNYSDTSINKVAAKAISLKDMGLIQEYYGYGDEASVNNFNSLVLGQRTFASDNLSIGLLSNRFTDVCLDSSYHSNDLGVEVSINGLNYLNIGGTDDDGNVNPNSHRTYSTIIGDNPFLKNDVSLFDVPNHGRLDEAGKDDLLFSFMNTIAASESKIGYTYPVINGMAAKSDDLSKINQSLVTWCTKFNQGSDGSNIKNSVITELYNSTGNNPYNGDVYAIIESEIVSSTPSTVNRLSMINASKEKKASEGPNLWGETTGISFNQFDSKQLNPKF